MANRRVRRSAFHNLRTAATDMTIFFGLAAAVRMSLGRAPALVYAALVASVLGGALGVGTYLVGRRVTARYLFVGAIVLGVSGLVGLITASQFTQH